MNKRECVSRRNRTSWRRMRQYAARQFFSKINGLSVLRGGAPHALNHGFFWLAFFV